MAYFYDNHRKIMPRAQDYKCRRSLLDRPSVCYEERLWIINIGLFLHTLSPTTSGVVPCTWWLWPDMHGPFCGRIMEYAGAIRHTAQNV